MIGSADEQKVETLVRTFRDLEVYKKAFSISLDVHRATLSFPQIEQFALSSQTRRASKGICANIAEGFAKQQSSKPEFKRFLMIALGSAHEMQVWIDYCKELEYIDDHIASVWKDEYEGIVKMLQAFINKL